VSIQLLFNHILQEMFIEINEANIIVNCILKSYGMNNMNSNAENLNQVNEEQPAYVGFVHKSEDERLKEDMMRSPIEKLQLFTKMLRREALFKKATILNK